MKLRQLIKKADIFLFIALVALGLASLLLVRGRGGQGQSAAISVDGRLYGIYSLAGDRVIDVDTKYGHNRVVISGGQVWVEESDCANHNCMDFGKISMPKQTIVCLPHRLIITVTGQSDIDALVY